MPERLTIYVPATINYQYNSFKSEQLKYFLIKQINVYQMGMLLQIKMVFKEDQFLPNIAG